MVEISPTLAQLQKQNLKDYQGKVFWHDDIQDVPKKTTFFIANEFFDALPIDHDIAAGTVVVMKKSIKTNA